MSPGGIATLLGFAVLLHCTYAVSKCALALRCLLDQTCERVGGP